MKLIKDTTVCIFAYKRDLSLSNILNDLKKNLDYQRYTYHFFVDYPKNIQDQKKHKSILNIINKFKNGLKIKVICRKKNIGLNQNIIKGINYVTKKYSKFIVLEDDLRVSKYYLNYIQLILDKFENDKNIFTVTGYTFPKKIFKLATKKNSIILSKRPNSWGWASWSAKWNKVNFNDLSYVKIYRDKSKLNYISKYGNDLSYILRDTLQKKIDSWAIKWTIYHILNNKYCIFPFKTMVNEEGFISKPTNNKLRTNKFNHYKIVNTKFPKKFKLILENNEIKDAFKKVYDFPLYKKILKKFI